MCTKKEVEEAIAAGIFPLSVALDYIKAEVGDIKEALKHPPCKHHGEKLTVLEMEYKALKESSEKFEEEKNKEVYPRLRDAETAIATLTQQNKGQDDWSSKTWAFIMIFVGAAINLLGWYLKGP